MTLSFLGCDEMLETQLAVPHGECGPPPRLYAPVFVEDERYRYVQGVGGRGQALLVGYAAE
jgi:hypothetical protein